MTESNPSGAAAPSPYLDHDELERIAHPVPGTAYRDGGRLQTMAAEILRLRKRVADAGDDADRCLARERAARRERDTALASIREALTEHGGFPAAVDPVAAIKAMGSRAISKQVGDLMQAMGILSTLAGSMQVDVNDPIGMAREIHRTVGDAIDSRQRTIGAAKLALAKAGIPCSGNDYLPDAIDRLAARDAAVRDHRHLWVDALAKVLLAEFGGPVGGSEGACQMAVRVLREQKAEIDRLRELFEDIDELMTQSMPGRPPLKPISGDWCGTNRPEMLPLTPKVGPATGEPRTEVAPGPDGVGKIHGSAPAACGWQF